MFYGSFFVSDPFPLLLVVPVFQIRFCFIFTGHLRVFFCYLIFLTYCLFGSGFNLSAYAPVANFRHAFRYGRFTADIVSFFSSLFWFLSPSLSRQRLPGFDSSQPP